MPDTAATRGRPDVAPQRVETPGQLAYELEIARHAGIIREADSRRGDATRAVGLARAEERALLTELEKVPRFAIEKLGRASFDGSAAVDDWLISMRGKAGDPGAPPAAELLLAFVAGHKTLGKELRSFLETQIARLASESSDGLIFTQRPEQEINGDLEAARQRLAGLEHQAKAALAEYREACTAERNFTLGR